MKENPDYKPKKDDGKATGFDDLDGDGDEIIDDAIIDEQTSVDIKIKNVKAIRLLSTHHQKNL